MIKQIPLCLPAAATLAELPGEIRLQIVSHCTEPPARSGWLHEIKHDGHRLVAIIAGERLKLVSRNGYDQTAFGARLCAISP